MDSGVYTGFLAFTQKDLCISGRQAVQLADVERTRIRAVIPDGTDTLHQGLQPGSQRRCRLPGIVQLVR